MSKTTAQSSEQQSGDHHFSDDIETEVMMRFQDSLGSDNVNESCGATKTTSVCPAGVRRVYIIDDNMYYSSMRYEYLQLAKKCE